MGKLTKQCILHFSHVTPEMERICITIEGGLVLRGDVLVMRKLCPSSTINNAHKNNTTFFVFGVKRQVIL